jgi:hypothetical protein
VWDDAPTFEEWNDAIGRHFFNRDHQGRDVTLCIDSELVGRLFAGYGVADLVAAVEDECNSERIGHRNPLCLGLRLLEEWTKQRRSGLPSYLPVLAVLILAVEFEDAALHEHAYWKRLFQLRSKHADDVEDVGVHRRHLEILFRDLSRWSCVEQREQLGRFELRRLGRWRFVGLIRAQVLLSAGDRTALERAFASQGFTSSSMPSRAELVQAAQTVLDQLRASVRRLLAAWPSGAMAAPLVDAIEDHLLRWDGTALSSDERTKVASTRLPLLLELRRRPVRGLQSIFRIDAGERVLPDELILSNATDTKLYAQFPVGRMSQPLTSSEDGLPFDAAEVDWCAGATFSTDSTVVQQVVFNPRSIRFFVHDGGEWIEESMLPVTGRCLVAYTAHEVPRLRQWFDRWLPASWSNLPDVRLPSGWSIARVDKVPDDQAAREAFPAKGLVSSESPSVQLTGGVRSPDGSYCAFSLPRARVRGGSADSSIRLAGVFDLDGRPTSGVNLREEQDSEGARLWRLEAEESAWTRLSIIQLELIKDLGVVEARCSVAVHLGSHVPSQRCQRNSWGSVISGTAVGATDARFEGFSAEPSDTTFTAFEHAGLQMKPADLRHGRSMFTQALAACGSLRWHEAKEIAHSMAASAPFESWQITSSLSMQFDAMRSLGRLEIAEDAEGFFSEVQSLPPSIHLLPARANVAGMTPPFPLQTVVTGAASERQFLQLLERTSRYGVTVHIQRQPAGYWLVPDRVTLLHRDIRQLNECAESASWTILPPFTLAASKHLQHPSLYLEHADWRAGPPPHGDQRLAFDVTRCCSRPELDVEGALVLAECREPYGTGRWSYWLYDRSGNRHARCQRQLGRWIVALAHPAGPKVMPASAHGDVYVPIELRPPLLVERAFCACSGLAPELVHFSPLAADWNAIGFCEPPAQLGRWLTGSHTHSGHWLCYKGVCKSHLLHREQGESVLQPFGLPTKTISILSSDRLEIAHA